MVSFWPVDHPSGGKKPRSRRSLPALLVVAVLSACSSGTVDSETINDPIEGVNRGVHAVNKGLDRALLRPISKVYGAVTPDEVENGVSNAVANLGSPGDAINHVLQGDPGAAVRVSGRFLLNSTIGVVGLLDPAKEFGLEPEPTDFGETLHVWGAGEGAYVELPLLGPSTLRDATGRVVDAVLDPVQFFAGSKELEVITGARALGIVDTRHRYGNVIDPTLYESADSYAAARTAYLQNRRRALKGETDEEDLDDPFAFE